MRYLNKQVEQAKKAIAIIVLAGVLFTIFIFCMILLAELLIFYISIL